jgi:hypothetical protein
VGWLKLKALSSNPSTTKKKEEEKKKRRRRRRRRRRNHMNLLGFTGNHPREMYP